GLLGARRGLIGAAAFAGAEAGAPCRLAALVKGDIRAIGPAGTAGRPAINAGGAHGIEESALRQGVAGPKRMPARLIAREARPRGRGAVGHSPDHSMLLHIGAKSRCAILGDWPRPNTPGLAVEFGKLPIVIGWA